MEGTRISSRSVQLPRPRITHRAVDEKNRLIGESIPFWPEVIKGSRLAKSLNITRMALDGRIDTIQEAYMIFIVPAGYSRLKDDLSNIDKTGGFDVRTNKKGGQG